MLHGRRASPHAPTREYATGTLAGSRASMPLAMHARAYLPAAQRALLELVDRRAPSVRSFVAEVAGPEAPALWNDCLASLHQWRRAHQKRGAMYLRTENASYHSVSGIVAKQDSQSRADAFERAMEEHVQETIEARMP